MSSLPPSSYFSPRPKKNENRQHSDESNASSSSAGASSLAKSQASEDSFITAINQRGLTGTDAISSGKQQSSASRGGVARSGDTPRSPASSGYHHPSVEVSRHLLPSNLSDKATTVSSVDTSPRSKRSKPITIELPSSAIAARKKSLPACTPDCEPLSARGDLIGGYFPFHENQGKDTSTSEQSYKPHPFDSTRQKAKDSFAGSEYQTSNSATMPSSSSRDATPRAPFQDSSLSIPLGKYHPSNYKITPTTSTANTPTTSSPSPLLPTNLQMPSSSRQHSSKSPRHHKRNPSDIKRKLQQYQRDMVQQAQTAAWSSTSPSGRGSTMPAGVVAKPVSPRLLPMVSPDELSAAMTPLELGGGIGSTEGYLGARSLGITSGGGSRECEMVGRMIRMEEERRRREGQSSPVGRV